MNLKTRIEMIFNEIIEKYAMKIVGISNNEVVLTKANFLLSFLCHSGELELVYVFKDEENNLYKCLIDSYLTNSFDDNDRDGIKRASNIEQRIDNELLIISRGLLNHWNNLLEGDKEWIKDYQRFDLSMPIRKISDSEQNLYNSIL